MKYLALFIACFMACGQQAEDHANNVILAGQYRTELRECLKQPDRASYEVCKCKVQKKWNRTCEGLDANAD